MNLMKPEPLLHINDLADRESKGFSVSEELSVFAIKKDDNLYLYKNRCPHLGIELEWVEHQFLDASNALIQCATHGAQFIIESGQCVSGPCMGQALTAMAFTQDDHGNIFL